MNKNDNIRNYFQQKIEKKLNQLTCDLTGLKNDLYFEIIIFKEGGGESVERKTKGTIHKALKNTINKWKKHGSKFDFGPDQVLVRVKFLHDLIDLPKKFWEKPLLQMLT